MNARALRMLFGAVALSAMAAVLAGGANARPAEGAGVPAEIYSASTSPVVDEHQTPQSGTFLVDPEIYSASTSPTVLSEQHDAQTELLQQTSVREKLGEIGAWAVPSLSQQTPLATNPTVVPDVDPSTFEGYRG